MACFTLSSKEVCYRILHDITPIPEQPNCDLNHHQSSLCPYVDVEVDVDIDVAYQHPRLNPHLPSQPPSPRLTAIGFNLSPFSNSPLHSASLRLSLQLRRQPFPSVMKLADFRTQLVCLFFFNSFFFCCCIYFCLVLLWLRLFWFFFFLGWFLLQV